MTKAIVALVSALALFLAGFSPAAFAAEDPFEKAAKRCEKEDQLKISCTVLRKDSGAAPPSLEEFVKLFRTTIEKVHEANDWPMGTVSGKTQIPFDKRFAYSKI